MKKYSFNIMYLIEIIPLLYFAIAIILFLGWCFLLKKRSAKQEGKCSYSTDSLILFGLVICSTFPISVPFILWMELTEYQLERRVKNGDPYITTADGKYIFKSDLKDFKKVEKILYGDFIGCGAPPYNLTKRQFKSLNEII